MNGLQNPRFILGAMILAALVLRMGGGVWWQSRLGANQRFGFGDSESYWVLGRAIANGDSYIYGADSSPAFRTPGYPILLAPLFWISNDPPVFWARIQVAFMATVAVAFVGWFAYRLFGLAEGLVAVGLAALAPDSIALGMFVLTEGPFCPFMMLQLLLWDISWRNPAGWRSLTAAFVGGGMGACATLIRPSWLLFTPFAMGVGWLVKPHEAASSYRWRQLVLGTVMMAGLIAGMAPWWIRNYFVVGRFVSTTLQVGASLYDGLNPSATGGSDMRFVDEFLREQRAEDALASGAPRGLFADRADQRMHRAAVTWARAHPQTAVWLGLVKFGRIWSPLPSAAEFQSPLVRWGVFWGYVPVMILACWGGWCWARKDWPYLLCLVPAVYFTLLHMVFVGSIRYRQPAMLPLYVLAAGVAVRCGRAWIAKDKDEPSRPDRETNQG